MALTNRKGGSEMLLYFILLLTVSALVCFILSSNTKKAATSAQEEATILPLNEEAQTKRVLFSKTQILNYEKSVLIKNIEKWLTEEYPQMIEWYIIPSSLGGIRYPQKTAGFDIMVKQPAKKDVVHIVTEKFFDYKWQRVQENKPEDEEVFCVKDFMKHYAKDFLKKEKAAIKNGQHFFILNVHLSEKALKKLEIHLMGARADLMYKCSAIAEGTRIEFFGTEEDAE